MAGKAFVDTNVLLRANHDAMPLHVEAESLVKQIQREGFELWVSRQVIREYLVWITRPGFLALPIPVEQAIEQINIIESLFQVADDTTHVTRKLLELIKKYPTAGKQIHDANIVATMLVHGVDTLLTQNVADMRRFASEIMIIPLFAAE